MRGVQAGKAFDLVGEAAVLVASLHELPPNLVEALVVLFQQLTVPCPHLQRIFSRFLPIESGNANLGLQKAKKRPKGHA